MVFYELDYSIFSFLEFRGCKDENDLISQYEINQQDEESDSGANNKTHVIAGIVFNDFESGENGEMPDLNYKIRMDSRDVFPETEFLFPRFVFPGPGSTYGMCTYLNTSVLQVIFSTFYLNSSYPQICMLDLSAFKPSLIMRTLKSLKM